MKVESRRLSDQFEHRRLPQQPAPPTFVRPADDNMTHTVIPGKFEQRFDGFFRAQAHNFGAEIPCSLLVIQKMPLQCRVDTVTRFAFGFDVNYKPVCV